MLIPSTPYRRFKDVCLLSGTAGHTAAHGHQANRGARHPLLPEALAGGKGESSASPNPRSPSPAHIIGRRPTSGKYQPHPADDGPLAASQDLWWKDFVELNTAQDNFNAPPSVLRISVAWALEEFTLFAMLRGHSRRGRSERRLPDECGGSFARPGHPAGERRGRGGSCRPRPTSRTRVFVTPAATRGRARRAARPPSVRPHRPRGRQADGRAKRPTRLDGDFERRRPGAP